MWCACKRLRERAFAGKAAPRAQLTVLVPWLHRYIEKLVKSSFVQKSYTLSDVDGCTVGQCVCSRPHVAAPSSLTWRVCRRRHHHGAHAIPGFWIQVLPSQHEHSHGQASACVACPHQRQEGAPRPLILLLLLLDVDRMVHTSNTDS